MSYLVLALKWRPQRFADLTGQEPVSRTLSNALKTGRAAQAYLFSGPRGVGKTSMARILAKALNCVRGPAEEPCNECDACREITSGHAMDVIEIDGASNRGIGDIRELREAVAYAPASLERKVYIIDEVHMLTQDAFNALLKTLEEPPRHVVFILATTEPLKVPQTILSRCQRFDFARLGVRDMAGRLRFICEQEGIEAQEDALVLIARRAEGSMRDALTLLDQVVATGMRPLAAGQVRQTLGLPNREIFFQWSEAIVRQDAAAILLSLAQTVEAGSNLQELAEEFLNHLRNLLLVATDPSLADLLETTEEESAAYLRQARAMPAADLLRYCRICLEAAGQMRRSAFPRTHLELALAEMCSLVGALDLKRFVEVARGKFGTDIAAPTTVAPTAAVPETSDRRPPAVSEKRSSSLMDGPPSVTTGGSVGESGGTRGSTGEPRNAASWNNGVSRNNGVSWNDGVSWNTVLSDLSARKPALASFLTGSWVSGEEENCLRVQVPGLSAFQKEQLERKPNRLFLLEMIEKTYGRALGLRWFEASGETPLGGDVGSSAGSSAGAAPGALPPPAPASSLPKKKGGALEASVDQIRGIADLFGGDVIGPA